MSPAPDRRPPMYYPRPLHARWVFYSSTVHGRQTTLLHVSSRSNAKHYGSYFNIPHHHSLCSSTFSSSWLSSWYTHGRKWTLSRKTSERRFIASIRRVTNAGASNW